MFHSSYYRKPSFAKMTWFNNNYTNKIANYNNNYAATTGPKHAFAFGIPKQFTPLTYQPTFEFKKHTPSVKQFKDSSSVDTNSEVIEPDTASSASGSEDIVKHPLMYTWTLWYLENDHSQPWEDLQNEITSFDTIEDFWSLYNLIKPPSELKVGSDYSLFKQGVRPMWEDAANKEGGRWLITIPQNTAEDLDTLWLNIILWIINESFELSGEICGIVVNNRPKINKISIWTAHVDRDATMEIGYMLKHILHLDHKLYYKLHKNAMFKLGPKAKPLYTV